MKRALRARLSYANVTATIALFIALGGSAYAAVHLPKNSVGARQIKPNAITSAKVKDQSLGGKDINLSTLGTVPSAANATHAASSDTAASANTSTTASGLAPLPSGKSESGAFAPSGGAAVGSFAEEGITFPQPLASRIPDANVEIIKEQMPLTSNCPGFGRAAPNHLCLYEALTRSVSSQGVNSLDTEPGIGKNGFIVLVQPTDTNSRVFGEWTVTAP
jgi:hypothetical protein